MKKHLLIFTLIFSLVYSSSFSQETKQLQENARNFMLQGDYTNAILILNRAHQKEPQNIELIKDLAFNYYMQKDQDKALETIKPTLDRDDVDDQCFQIAGNIYKALGLPKDCEKLYRKGIKKFPGSGAMYNELGEILWAQTDYDAIAQWEKGIEVDPNYSKNYYNACRYYYLSTDKVWGLLYGEIFINMEPLSSRTPEIKNILLEGYKKLFAEVDITKNNKEKNKFTEAFIKVMNKQSSMASAGINPETLTMIRTRFILDWYYDPAGNKFPFKLFEMHRQLLQEGLFDAYNQWIFGSVQNLAAYQSWTNSHSADYTEFSRFQKGRTFKIPFGQFYH